MVHLQQINHQQFNNLIHERILDHFDGKFGGDMLQSAGVFPDTAAYGHGG